MQRLIPIGTFKTPPAVYYNKATQEKLLEMKKFPVLRTERLLLNQLKHTDIPTIVSYAGDEKIASFTLNIPHPYQAEDAVFWLNLANQGFANKTGFVFAIRDQEERFMGGIGLNIDRRHNRGVLGYWIGVPFWGNGYMTEAAQAVIRFGFETLALNRIYCTHLLENPASGKVMIKNGMIKEGELIDFYKKGDQYRSVIQYRLTRSEFERLVR